MPSTAVQTYPPLGQVTPLQTGHFTLDAVLSAPISQTKELWEVSLWYSTDGAEWAEARLQPLTFERAPQSLGHDVYSSNFHYFSSEFEFKDSLQFTVKYRQHLEKDWIWGRDVTKLGDGMVILQSPSAPSDSLEDIVQDLGSDWHVSSCLSQTPRTLLWSTEAKVPALETGSHEVKGDGSTFRDIPLGTLHGGFFRWFALVRQSLAWLAPRHGKDSLALDKEAILCAFLTPRGRYIVFLALENTNHVLSSLQSNADGGISVHVRSDSVGENKPQPMVLISESDNLGRGVAAVMYHSKKLTWASSQASTASKTDFSSKDAQIRPQGYEDWYDGLGYCTWNALGQNLTETKLFEAIEDLRESDIHVSNLILDDGWQTIDNRSPNQFERGLVDFEADPTRFPRGLQSTVTHLRSKHPYIQHIAVWHALLGYWGGIAPEGKLTETYKTIELSRKSADPLLDGKMAVVGEDDVERFYQDFYAFLEGSGIDSVKTDVQFMMDAWTDASARRRLLHKYLDTWGLASLRSFSMRATSCMSMFSQAIFYSQMSSLQPAFPVRSSDDFFPDVPTAHPWHVWANANNCILMQHLNAIPDWDMFQTDHDFGGFHAAARCVSGGPIYITDPPGKHNKALIHEISGKTPRGKTIIFRPSVVGKSVTPFVGPEDNTLLKVGSYHGASETGTPILGVFNVSNCSLVELIPLSTFSGTVGSLEYVVRAHTSGKVTTPMSLCSTSALCTVALDTGQYEVLCAYPLKHLSRIKGGSVKVANLGLLGRMTGCAAIVSNKIFTQDNGRCMVDTNVKAFGTLGLYISCLPELSLESDFMVTIQSQAIPIHAVTKSDRSQYVLEVDFDKAWQEMELETGWSNEIQIKIGFTA